MSCTGGWQDGATAVCVWILDQKVFVANIGDAKAVLARSSTTNELGNHTEAGNPLKAIVLTREHKAIYPQERSRIQKSGGVISSNGRLQGRLEVSRAFGDRHFKKFGVSATPDIHAFELTERENFMILGCDGLWEVSKLFVCGFAVLYKNISFCLYISKFAAHTQCNRFQVFGPSDAVGFVQKLLKVNTYSCQNHFVLHFTLSLTT